MFPDMPGASSEIEGFYIRKHCSYNKYKDVNVTNAFPLFLEEVSFYK